MKRFALLLAALGVLVGTVGFTFVPNEDIVFIGRSENVWIFQHYVDGGLNQVGYLKGTSRDPYGVEQHCYDNVIGYTLDCYISDIWNCPEGSGVYLFLEHLIADPSIGYGEPFYLECEDGGEA